MAVVRIGDACFADLSLLKTWFGTSTPSETIEHLVRRVMDQMDLERDEDVGTEDAVLHIPGLTHTKPLKALVNGCDVDDPSWLSILLAVIYAMKMKGMSGTQLVEELKIGATAEICNQHGYRFFPHLGISIQGKSSQETWKEIDRLARAWRIPVRVEFQWRQNEKAQHPGKTGVLSVNA